MPKLEIELKLEQLAQVLRSLNPGELETLELMISVIMGVWSCDRTRLQSWPSLSLEPAAR